MSDNDTIITATLYSSPVGELCVGQFRNAICLCDWTGGSGSPRRRVLSALLRMPGCGGLELVDTPSEGLLREAVRQLDAYFSGALTSFDLPLLFGGTEFQRQIWERLLHIPYGETVSYSDLCPGAPMRVRAAAGAVGANPMSIIVPCHRVTRKAGARTLHTGYAGGVDAKLWLLGHEAEVSRAGQGGC